MVEDDERLFRSVPKPRPGLEPFTFVDGKLKFGTQSFSSREFKPSVDRAILNGNNPTVTQKTPDAGVVTLLAREVRAIVSVKRTHQNGDVSTFQVDVMPDELQATDSEPENLAHALIVTIPSLDISTKSVFRKLQEALALIATRNGWTIAPR